MFQNADGNFTGQFNTRAALQSNGEIKWEIPMIFRSSCKIDVTYFPYDTQNCSLTFRSWTYDRTGIKGLLFFKSQLKISCTSSAHDNCTNIFFFL